MPHSRFYSNQDLKKHITISIYGEEFRHMTKVMRKKEEMIVEIINGKGMLATAKIKTIEKDCANLYIEDLQITPFPKIKRYLIQALCKHTKTDFILEKATELGIDHFIFFPAEKSIKKTISDNQLDRMHKILIAATKQSGRTFLPEISYIQSLEKIPKSLTLFYGDIDPKAPFISKKIKEAKDSSIGFIVGPESGFSQRELAYLHKQNFEGVSLNQNILRAETASICAASFLEMIMH
ncbi:MAG TPA: RsmE family RNA methyltransferase [Chlamydiales bacterium]|nr:RsmE family RNA methyltransferase [Chlamydiales bacterium]